MQLFDSVSVCGPILGVLLMTLGPATGEMPTTDASIGVECDELASRDH